MNLIFSYAHKGLHYPVDNHTFWRRTRKRRLSKVRILLITTLFIFLLSRGAFFSPAYSFNLTWEEQDIGFPPGITLFRGISTSPPLLAWYAEIDPTRPDLVVRPFLAKSPLRVSAMARGAGAFLAINTGYCWEGRSLSLIKHDGRVLSHDVGIVFREGVAFYPTRATFGIRYDDTVDVTWTYPVWQPGGAPRVLYSYPQPSPISPGNPAPPPTASFPAGGRRWANIRDAVGGGPMLVRDGVVHITWKEEAFQGSGLIGHDRLPRTAIGVTAAGKIVFFIADRCHPGRVMGMTLPELAETLIDIGVVDAINLDGAGNTTLVAMGHLITRPSCRPRARPVMSMIAVIPQPVTLPGLGLRIFLGLGLGLMLGLGLGFLGLKALKKKKV